MVAVILLAAVGLYAWSSRPAPPDDIAWHATMEDAMAASAESGKPVFVKFTATWCGPCKQMDRSTFPDSRVGEALEAFEPVKVDVDQHSDLAAQYNISSIPALFVISPEGEVQARYSGALGPVDFVSFLTD
jgi:thiol:disulfide interchange protein